MATFREAEKARIGFVGADQNFKLLSSIGVRWDRPHPGPFNWQFIEPA